MTDPADLGREAFARRDWRDAHAAFSTCETLSTDDVERLAIASHLVGRDDDSASAWQRAHLGYVSVGDHDHAARCAFWLAMALLLQGDEAQAGGWLARAERVIEAAGHECGARGYVLVPAFLGLREEGDYAGAETLARDIVDIAQRFADTDLLALGLLCHGEVSLARGETIKGMKLLDEAMISVTTDEVSPIPAGIIYCAVVEACIDACDMRRAGEWTTALQHWCDAQPGLVPYRGQCLVHRSQVLQARGAWTDAITEAERARERLSEPPHPALGLAYYQRGELYRLRGEFPAAERHYRTAGEHGREPAPGLALLRLAQGQVDLAVASVRRMVDESHSQLARPTMLAAAVEVLLAAGQIDAARGARDELAAIAALVDVPLRHAAAAYATGTVLRAEGNAPGALDALRQACTTWRTLEMPYEAARAQEEMGRAYQMLGDHDAASVEFEAARATFERLHAAADLVRIEQLTAPRKTPARPAELTDRECEVLRQVAAGKTNREIAAELIISEHTVARHLQNIFMKLDLPSRAAATAYAYEHGLIARGEN